MERKLLFTILLSLVALCSYAEKPKAPQRQGWCQRFVDDAFEWPCNEDYPLYGDVDSIEIFCYSNSQGKEELTHKNVFKFNERGDLVKLIGISYGIEKNENQLNWKYDSQGRMVESPGIMPANEFASPPEPMDNLSDPFYNYGDGTNVCFVDTFDVKYDSLGRRVSCISSGRAYTWKYDSRGNMVRFAYNEYASPGWGETWENREEIYRYDLNGNKVNGIVNINGRVACRLAWKYDSRGNLIEFPYYGYNECHEYAVQAIVRRKYDSRNHLVEEGHFKYANALDDFEFIKTWKYDARGNIIEQSYYDHVDGKDVLRSKVTFSYDSKGNKVEEKTYDGKGVLGHKVTFSYDSKGNKIEEKTYDGKGVQSSRTTWKYDSNGTIIEERRYGNNDRLTGVSMYDSYGNLIEKRCDSFLEIEIKITYRK